MHIKLGDEGRYSATKIGTITSNRESGSPLRLKYVMFVPSLNKNLIFVVVLEDHGYDVIFNQGKSFPETHSYWVGEADLGSCEELV